MSGERLSAPLGHDPTLSQCYIREVKIRTALQEDLVILSGEILCGADRDLDLNKLKQ